MVKNKPFDELKYFRDQGDYMIDNAFGDIEEGLKNNPHVKEPRVTNSLLYLLIGLPLPFALYGLNYFIFSGSISDWDKFGIFVCVYVWVNFFVIYFNKEFTGNYYQARERIYKGAITDFVKQYGWIKGKK